MLVDDCLLQYVAVNGCHALARFESNFDQATSSSFILDSSEAAEAEAKTALLVTSDVILIACFQVNGFPGLVCEKYIVIIAKLSPISFLDRDVKTTRPDLQDIPNSFIIESPI